MESTMTWYEQKKVLMAVGGSLNRKWHLLFILHLLLPVGVVLSLQFSQSHL